MLNGLPTTLIDCGSCVFPPWQRDLFETVGTSRTLSEPFDSRNLCLLPQPFLSSVLDLCTTAPATCGEISEGAVDIPPDPDPLMEADRSEEEKSATEDARSRAKRSS